MPRGGGHERQGSRRDGPGRRTLIIEALPMFMVDAANCGVRSRQIRRLKRSADAGAQQYEHDGANQHNSTGGNSFILRLCLQTAEHVPSLMCGLITGWCGNGFWLHGQELG